MRTSCLVYLAVLLNLAVAGAGDAFAASYTMDVAPDRADGVYKQGQEVAFRIMVLRDGRPFNGQSVSYTITRSDGAQVASGSGQITGKPVIAKAKVDGPALVTCNATYSTGNISDSLAASAVVAPELFKPSAAPPGDFDAFWQAQRQLLASTPIEASMQPAAPPGDADALLKRALDAVDVFDVQAATVAGVAPLTGQLARPKGARPKSLPAVLYPQAHGPRMARVRPSREEMMRAARGGGRPPTGTLKGDPGPALSAAKAGMLALSFHLDDLPGAQPAATTTQPKLGASDAAASGATADGTADRESHFLRGAILRTLRALDLLARQPEWNGTVLVVQGDGIGGGLALAAAGLDARVTLCVAGAPAMCDLAATEPRRAGWPHAAPIPAAPAAPRAPGAPQPQPPPPPAPPDEKARQAAAYFDAAHFAARVKCPTVITIDYNSRTAPPVGVLAAFASVPAAANKQLIRVGERDEEKLKLQAQLDAIVRKHVTAPGAAPRPPTGSRPVPGPAAASGPGTHPAHRRRWGNARPALMALSSDACSSSSLSSQIMTPPSF